MPPIHTPAALALAASLALPALSHAALLASDSFESYALGEIDGQIPPAGSPFVGFATEQGTPSIIGGNLGLAEDSPQVLRNTSPGNSLVNATLDTSPTGPFSAYLNADGDIGASGTTLYFSYWLNTSGAEEPGPVSNEGNVTFLGGEVVQVGTDPNTNDPIFDDQQLIFGKIFNRETYQIVAGGGVDNQSIATYDSGPHLLVLRIDFADGDDTVTAFFDPDPTLDEASQASVATVVDPVAFDTIQFRSRQVNDPVAINNTDFDDVRFGTTFASVVPIPEPASAGLAAAGMLGLLARRRR